MTLYSYKTVNNKGITNRGKIDANSKVEAASMIKEDGLYVVEIKEAKSGFLRSFKKENSLGAFERINFTDHVSSLIKAGTPIKDALEAYIDEGGEGSTLIREIVSDIERGKKLSDAFAKHPRVFPPLYISLIKAGEAAGNLDETLEYLANELRREYEFKQRVRSALFYPALVLGASFFVIIFILVFVVPKITQIAKNLGENIPKITQILISISDFFSHNFAFLTLGFIGLIILVIYAFKNEKLKDDAGARMLKMPLIGKILKKYILARFMRIIASCVKYGIPLSVAFQTGSEVVGNKTYRESCARMSEKIQKGIALSYAIASEGKDLFPGIITRSLRGAEKTGGIDTALNRLSIQYEIEVDRDLKKLTELMEPVMVIILGIIVLLIALSVVAPIYQLTSNFG